MSGALMQLVAYGVQDLYLTGNPMITYFKVVYRRHTNFAMESISQSFNSVPDLGTTVSALIARNGDLMGPVYLQATLPSISGNTSRWIDNVGHFLIKQVTLEIGGQLIDRHFGDWLEIWSQLTVPAGQKVGYLEMIGQDAPDVFNRLTGLQAHVLDGAIPGRTVYVPLQFWFCRHTGLALPLIALQYHEVKINIEFQILTNLVRGTNPSTVGSTSLTNVTLWVDYYYLDTEERRRFAQVTHEYLIEQVQHVQSQISCNLNRTTPGYTSSTKLNFNHPVKELIWVIRNNSTTPTQPANFTSVAALDVVGQATAGGIGSLGTSGLGAINTQAQLTELIGQSSVVPPGASNPVISAQLLLNGHDRFGTRPGSYFNLMQPWRYHTAVPESPGINVYSFSIFPEAHQPSGTCNFSRIDSAYLVLQTGIFTNDTRDRENYPGIHETQQAYSSGLSTLHVYAVNYNVLRITSGMGGLAYNN